MSEHTAGPWINRHWGTHGNIVIAANGFTGPNTFVTVGTPSKLTVERQEWVVNEACVLEAEANAHLITAAPDLLAACKGVMEFLSNGSPVQPGCLLQAEVFNAIQKAEGYKGHAPTQETRP